jgi:hypothetical protein
MATPIRSLDVVDILLTTSSANVATSLTQAGVPGQSLYISYFNWRVSGSAPVGASNCALTVKDGTTTIYSSAIPAAAPNGTNLSLMLPHPIKITAGNSVTYSIGSPGNAGCIIYANMGLFLR